MGTFSDTLADLTLFSCGYAELLLKGIDSKLAARKPSLGETVIDTNHPTFVFGHLALYPARIFAVTGADPKSVEVPPAWTDLFKAGVQCVDDPQGTRYPSLDAVVAHFMMSSKSAAGHLRTVPESTLSAANPNEQQRGRFPTVGTLLSFYTLGHNMMHLGQVSVWRRCFGLPSAM